MVLERKEKTGLQGLFFVKTKDRVREQRREIECSERVQEKGSGQCLPGAEEFMVDLSLFAAALQ